MAMKKINIILILIIAAGATFYFIQQQSLDSENKSVIINDHKFTVEIANDSRERAMGLSGRENLCESCGMLFEFPESGKYSFWMQGMMFSLDIIWILDNRIVHIERDIHPDFQESLSPEVEADKVLEINAGKSDEFGIKVGDRILLHN